MQVDKQNCLFVMVFALLPNKTDCALYRERNNDLFDYSKWSKYREWYGWMESSRGEDASPSKLHREK